MVFCQSRNKIFCFVSPKLTKFNFEKKNINSFNDSNKININNWIESKIDKNQILKLVDVLIKVRKRKGRVFFLGVGGSAANCSHAVNDFRKICEIECYAPTDNVSELTARINDEGWESSLKNWLKVSNLNSKDAIFIMSVGGGNQKKNVSVNLIKAIEFSKKRNAFYKRSYN